jgi:hypothetical protein
MKFIQGVNRGLVNLALVQYLEVQKTVLFTDQGVPLWRVVAIFSKLEFTTVHEGPKSSCELYLGVLHLNLRSDDHGLRIKTDLELLNGPGLVPQDISYADETRHWIPATVNP